MILLQELHADRPADRQARAAQVVAMQVGDGRVLPQRHQLAIRQVVARRHVRRQVFLEQRAHVNGRHAILYLLHAVAIAVIDEGRRPTPTIWANNLIDVSEYQAAGIMLCGRVIERLMV